MNDNLKFWKGGNIESMTGNNIFVFGSNPSGIHGAGAAKAAMNFGAEYGNGRGLQGNTYALVTKNLKAGYYEESTGITYDVQGERSVSPEQISQNIDELYECARNNPNLKFFITYQKDPNTKNLNGYSDEEMFDLFVDNKDVPDNIRFHESFKALYQHKKESKNAKEEKFEFFWKADSPFSQWHPSLFTYKDVQFISCEQFMMYSKAKLFGDDEVADKIMHYNESLLAKDFINENIEASGIINDRKNFETWSKIQKKFKDLGKEVKNFNEEKWKEKRVPIITVGNREKYSQNTSLKEQLLATDDKTLVEASPYDRVYGIGLNKNSKEAQDRTQWKGLNLLGEAITNVKTKMQEEQAQKNENQNTQRKKSKPK